VALKLIYRSDPGARQARLQFEDLGVVWRDDQDVDDGEGCWTPPD
jgi:hypothetical protein